MGRKPKERCYGWRCCITQPAKGVCFFPDLRLTMELPAWKRAILRINVGMDQSLIRWCFRVQPIGPLRYHSEIAIGWWRSVQFHCGVWQLHAITTIVKLTNYGKTNCETKHTELQHSETSNNSLCFFHQQHSHHCGPHLAMNVVVYVERLCFRKNGIVFLWWFTRHFLSHPLFIMVYDGNHGLWWFTKHLPWSPDLYFLWFMVY